ncbi:YjcZ family sporulation protein [Bacillus subtilis]|nr:YjcZ family sporulation protein [Bacillus subtilis]WOO47829.1 YjcZ family sporulation protein [Bacillus subtilis]
MLFILLIIVGAAFLF